MNQVNCSNCRYRTAYAEKLCRHCLHSRNYLDKLMDSAQSLVRSVGIFESCLQAEKIKLKVKCAEIQRYRVRNADQMREDNLKRCGISISFDPNDQQFLFKIYKEERLLHEVKLKNVIKVRECFYFDDSDRPRIPWKEITQGLLWRGEASIGRKKWDQIDLPEDLKTWKVIDFPLQHMGPVTSVEGAGPLRRPVRRFGSLRLVSNLRL